MSEIDFDLEAGPFEMGEEFETPRSRYRPGGAPRPPQRPGPNRRPRPQRRVVRPVFVGRGYPPTGPDECEVLLILEGYSGPNAGLEEHHRPMLERLAAHLRRMSGTGTIEVVAVTPSGQARGDGDLGDRRTKAVVDRLRELVKSNSGWTFRRLARQTRGPVRVEIRICGSKANRRTR